MNRNDIEKMVITILSTVLKKDFSDSSEITRENTPEWDSLKHVEVIFTLEDEFEVEFSEAEMAAMDSVSKISELVEGKHAS